VLVYPGGGWGNSVWCLVLTCLVCGMSHKQVWSQWQQPPNFLTVTCCGEVFPSLCFLLDGGEEEKERKKITIGKEGFPRAGPTLLALQRVAAVRCS
jgi:hypothetical protein